MLIKAKTIPDESTVSFISFNQSYSSHEIIQGTIPVECKPISSFNMCMIHNVQCDAKYICCILYTCIVSSFGCMTFCHLCCSSYIQLERNKDIKPVERTETLSVISHFIYTDTDQKNTTTQLISLLQVYYIAPLPLANVTALRHNYLPSCIWWPHPVMLMEWMLAAFTLVCRLHMTHGKPAKMIKLLWSISGYNYDFFIENVIDV